MSFDKFHLENNLIGKTLFNKVFLFKNLDSTNNFAKSSRHNNIIVIAENQFKGRGRFERSWVSEKGKNLTFTLKFPKINNISDSTLNMFCSLMTILYLESTFNKIIDNFFQFEIKWPNDILLNRKKLSGILIEKRKNNYIVGYGININQTYFKNLPYATSIKKEFGIDINIEQTLIEFIQFFSNNFYLLDERYEKLIYNIWVDKIYTIGNKVKYNEIQGYIRGFTQDGGIIIEHKNTEKTYFSGEIKIEY